MNKFWKGIVNNNRKHFLECTKENNLVQTKTLHEDKKKHLTTWISLEQVQNRLIYCETVHRNTYRNQINYIICKKMYRVLF